MKQSLKTALTLAVVGVLSFGILWGGDRLTHAFIEEQQTAKAAETFGELLNARRFEPLDTASFEEITAAFRGVNDNGNTVGYGVTVTVRGYVDTIEVHAALSADGTVLRGVRIGAHRETAGYGARIETASFLRQFEQVQVPLSLNGASAALKDGTYRVAAAEADDSGFRDVVELTVENGQITAANWDAVRADGVGKKELSRKGEYVMTPDGLPWHEQAELMEQALLRTQDPAAIVYDAETGKTDAYSGASVRVDPFVKLAALALAKAAGDTASGTPIDGLSGATASSKAVVAAVNTAVQFVKRQTEE